jgi:hypothetical protein
MRVRMYTHLYTPHTTHYFIIIRYIYIYIYSYISTYLVFYVYYQLQTDNVGIYTYMSGMCIHTYKTQTRCKHRYLPIHKHIHAIQIQNPEFEFASLSSQQTPSITCHIVLFFFYPKAHFVHVSVSAPSLITLSQHNNHDASLSASVTTPS